MADISNMAHIQGSFFTNEDGYKIDAKTSSFDLPGEVGVDELSSLVNKILKEKWEESGDGDGQYKNVAFDFLIDGEFLRGPLNKLVDSKGLSTESVLPIEYLVKQEEPKAEDTYQHDDWISSVHSTKKYILTGTYDCKISIWGMGDSESCVPGIGHTEPVKSVSWLDADTKEGPMYAVSTSQDQSAILWKWEEGEETMKPLFCCRGHSKSVDCVAVHGGSEVFCTGSWDTLVKVWSSSPTPENDSNEAEDYQKTRNKKKRQRIEQRGVTRVPKMTLSGHKEAVSGLVWLSKNELCSVSWDHTIRIWDINEGKETTNLRAAKVFLACDYSQKNNLLATGNSDRHIRIWDPRGKADNTTEASMIKSNLTSHTGWVTCLKWSPVNDRQLVSGSLDATVKLWDIRSPKTPLFDLDAHQDKVMCLDWSNEHIILSGGADKNLYKFRYSS